MNPTNILLMTGGQAGGLGQFIPLILIIVVLIINYYLLTFKTTFLQEH